MNRRTKTNGAIALGAIVAVILLVTVVARAPFPANGVVVGTNVVFRPSAAWTDVSFASEQHFTNAIVVRPLGVTFDGVAFDVSKIPRALPRAVVTILVWSPAAPDGSMAAQFTVSSALSSVVWFNVTACVQTPNMTRTWTEPCSLRGATSAALPSLGPHGP